MVLALFLALTLADFNETDWCGLPIHRQPTIEEIVNASERASDETIEFEEEIFIEEAEECQVRIDRKYNEL